MEEKTGRKPSRDYPSLASGNWPLWDVLYGRRSVRKYTSSRPDDEFVEELELLVRLALTARGAPEDGIVLVCDRAKGEQIRRRSYKGLVNKINVWLARQQVNDFLVMTVPHDDYQGGRPIELPKMAMAVEDVVLWLTEKGKGSCWLGGVNEREIKGVLSLREGVGVPAIICFGETRAGSQPGYDALMARALSRRRKPLEKVAFLETAYRPYPVEPPRGAPFAVSEQQDIDRLLRDIVRGGPFEWKADVPLGIALEACMEAARVAPSGGNAQAWKFIAVRDDSRLKEIVSLLPQSHATAAEGAPWRAAIVAAGMTNTMTSRMLDKPHWMIDVPIAISHMSLMAVSMGMRAAVSTDGLDEAEINKMVGLSSGWRSVGVMTIA